MIAAGPGARAPLPFDPGGVWITHVNAPEAMHALGYLDPASWRGRYRIGFWVWELERIPAAWIRASRAFHEIWVPSRFVADAMSASGVPRRSASCRIRSRSEQPRKRNRAPFQFAENEFVVLSMGDLSSSLARKNLLGAIAIYRQAFPEAALGRRHDREGAGNRPHAAIDAAVSAAIAGRPDIILMADKLSAADARSLIASADVFLSPHRSEGFGLPLAEAFLAGVPALATGWSGNLDFMSGLPDLLIPHTLAPVDDPTASTRRNTGVRVSAGPSRTSWMPPQKLRRLAGNRVPARRTRRARAARPSRPRPPPGPAKPSRTPNSSASQPNSPPATSRRACSCLHPRRSLQIAAQGICRIPVLRHCSGLFPAPRSKHHAVH